MNGVIYCITNIANNKKYFGQTRDIIDRKRNHFGKLKRNQHPNPHLQNSWNKYGEINFRFDIILICPIEKLDEEEIMAIKENKTMDKKYGYNLRSGGNVAITISDETRKRISDAQKGIPSSDETKKRQSEAMKLYYLTHDGHMLGKKCSTDTKEKMSKSKKGKTLSEEIKKNMSLGKIGSKNPRFGKPISEKNKVALLISHSKPCSEETKRKISQGWSEETKAKASLLKTGNKNPNFGKPMSEETKIRLKEARKKYWEEKRAMR